MTLSIKNGGYAFLIRLDLMLTMPLWKEFQLLQILHNLSIKHLIELILFFVPTDVINLCGKIRIWKFCHYGGQAM